MENKYYHLKAKRSAELGRITISKSEEFVSMKISRTQYLLFGDFPPFIITLQEMDKFFDYDELIRFETVSEIIDKKSQRHFNAIKNLEKRLPKVEKVFTNEDKKTTVVVFDDGVKVKTKARDKYYRVDGIVWALAKRMAGSFAKIEEICDKAERSV